MPGESYSHPGPDSHQERFVPPQAETRELSRAEQITQNRDHLLTNARLEQAEKLPAVSHNYRQSLDAVDAGGAEQLFEEMNQTVSAWLHHTADTVHGMVEQSAAAMQPELTRKDQKLIHGFQKDVAKFGFSHAFRTFNLSHLPSADSPPAVTLMLDYFVDQNVQHQVRTYDAASPWVEEAIQLGSTEELRQALRASLDAEVIDSVFERVRVFDVTSPWVDEAVQRGTTDTVRQAIRESLDISVLDKVRHDATRARTADATESIKFGSSERVRQLIGELVAVPKAPPPTPDAEEDVKTLVDRVASEYRVSNEFGGLEWLRQEDPAKIRRVIDLVKTLRTDAAASGEKLTDRKIYTNVFRIAQESHVKGPDQSGQIEGETPEDNDFRILNALMGGKPGGTIPFK